MNHIQERQTELKKNLIESYSDSSILAVSAAEFIEKGKKANLGEVREWKGQKMQKTTTGWVPYGENGGKVKSHGEEKPSKVVMNKEIMDGLKALKVDPSNYEKLKAHYGGQEKLHEAIGDLLEGKGSLPQDVLYGDGKKSSPEVKVGQVYHAAGDPKEGMEPVDWKVVSIEDGKYKIETSNKEGRKGEHTFDKKTIDELVSESKLKSDSKSTDSAGGDASASDVKKFSTPQLEKLMNEASKKQNKSESDKKFLRLLVQEHASRN